MLWKVNLNLSDTATLVFVLLPHKTMNHQLDYSLLKKSGHPMMFENSGCLCNT